MLVWGREVAEVPGTRSVLLSVYDGLRLIACNCWEK